MQKQLYTSSSPLTELVARVIYGKIDDLACFCQILMEGGNYDTAPVLYTGKKSQSLNTFSSTAYTDKVRLI